MLVLLRSALFVFRPALAFDSDQAIFGLMAKHLADGRAFPLFLYGTSYILAIEAWLAAPIFLVAGASVAALKLPLLAINLAIAIALIVLLVRESRLGSWSAFVAALFFVAVPPGTATELLAPIGGNVEPLLYVLLLWITRRRPALFGFILGIGFLQREFTLYGAVAILLLRLAGTSDDRPTWRGWFAALRVAVEVWLVVQVIRPLSSPAGPGTTMRDLATAPNNLANLAGRICFDPASVFAGLGRLATVHWPLLFGTMPAPISAFLVETTATQGAPWSGLLLATAAIVMAVRVAGHATAIRARWEECRFPIYLLLVGSISAFVYAAGRCGELTVGTMRYDLLSILGAVGLTALFLVLESRARVRALVVGLVLAWSLVSASAHARLWREALGHPQVPDKILIVRSLDARGIRYAMADYWLAYYITFMTNERIIVAADDVGRVPWYEQRVREHAREAVRISRTPCGDTPRVIEGVYVCPLQ